LVVTDNVKTGQFAFLLHKPFISY